MSVTPTPSSPEPREGDPQEPAKSGALPWTIAACALGGCCLFAAFAIPNVIEARKASGEAREIGALRTLTTAQALCREGDKDRNGTFDYAVSLENLGRVGLIDKVLATGTKHGYRFMILEASAKTWSATTTPLEAGKSGDRSFFVDETGVIRFRRSPNGEPATALDQAIGG